MRRQGQRRTGLSSSSRCVLTAAFFAAALVAASPALARDADKQRPITDSDPTMLDIAKTPLTDLNIGRDKDIPPVLVAAVNDPYSLAGLSDCPALTAAVQQLDDILGPDYDLPRENRAQIRGGQVAQWVVGSFIPFRGLIRQVSGANAKDHAIQVAIQGGLARRGFLKGVGAQMHCAYPATPATPQVIKAYLDALDADAKGKGDGKADAKDDDKTSAGSAGETVAARSGSGQPAVALAADERGR